MSAKKTIKFHIGDYVANKDGIGKILDMCLYDGKPQFLVDYVVKASSYDWSCGTGVIGALMEISPLKASKEFSSATAEDFAKAKKYVELCDECFQAILSKYSKDSVTS